MNSHAYEKLLNYIEKIAYVVIQIEFSSVNFTNISTNFWLCLCKFMHSQTYQCAFTYNCFY